MSKVLESRQTAAIFTSIATIIIIGSFEAIKHLAFKIQAPTLPSEIITLIFYAIFVGSVAWVIVGKLQSLHFQWEDLKIRAAELEAENLLQTERLKAEKTIEVARVEAEKVLEVAKVEAEKSLAVERVEAEKKLEIARVEAENKLVIERGKTHQATLVATYHYLNNALNEFQLVLLELETTGSVNKVLVEQIKASISRTASEMREFGELKSPTAADVHKFIQDHL